MFTGIIESLGEVVELRTEGTNLVLRFKVKLDAEPIQIDQSIAHNGTCLTVTEIFQNESSGEKEYEVVAVQETLEKTNLGKFQKGDVVNVERCMKVGQRLDGHFVQGHVDTVGEVAYVEDRDGSWMVGFKFPEEHAHLMVDKGSITINGVSLTVVECDQGTFNVTIIPYTWEHTNFHTFKEGTPVNLEFDILGKYITKMNR